MKKNAYGLPSTTTLRMRLLDKIRRCLRGLKSLNEENSMHFSVKCRGEEAKKEGRLRALKWLLRTAFITQEVLRYFSCSSQQLPKLKSYCLALLIR